MITLYGHQLNALFKIIDMHWHAIEYIGCMSIEHMHILWNSTDMHCSDLKFKYNASKSMDMQGPALTCVCIAIKCQWHAGTCRGVQFKSLTCNCKSLTCNWHALTCIETRLKFIECICNSLTCFCYSLTCSLNEFGCIVMQANCDWRALKYKW